MYTRCASASRVSGAVAAAEFVPQRPRLRGDEQVDAVTA